MRQTREEKRTGYPMFGETVPLGLWFRTPNKDLEAENEQEIAETQKSCPQCYFTNLIEQLQGPFLH